MNIQQPLSRMHIGMRNIKTAFAATLVAFVYLLFDRNPTFACIGAVFGMGYDMSSSWLFGGNRLFGTIFGGLIGMALFSIYIQFYPEGGFEPLMLLVYRRNSSNRRKRCLQMAGCNSAGRRNAVHSSFQPACPLLCDLFLKPHFRYRRRRSVRDARQLPFAKRAHHSSDGQNPYAAQESVRMHIFISHKCAWI